MQSRICEMFGIDLPIFAFSHCRDVVAEVSKAGGFGVLGALYFTPEELENELRWIDEHVGGKPYGVDVVMPASYAGAGNLDPATMAEKLAEMIPQGHRDYIDQVMAKYDVPQLPEDEKPRDLLGWTEEGARPQIDVALSHPIKLLVNALGPPPKDIIDLAHEKGIKVAALVGRTDQAIKQVEQGVDIIVAQGYEAGGHTGEIASMVLTPEIVDAVGPVPVLSAGGIGSGRQMAAAMALGADGVWTGSIWLTTTESDMTPMMIDKLLNARSNETVRSRSLTGKPARQLKTAWTEAWDGPESPGTLPMPLQFMATSEAYHRINKFQIPELVGAPVGQIVGIMNERKPVKDVIFGMVEEFVEVTENLSK
ncbi:MAG TPA: nitronate monooxygenase family protein, partial [Acidimicrobiales bacterium]|nr:nitronate monooxygenase family protein [Acidimicrobiales bacterium]